MPIKSTHGLSETQSDSPEMLSLMGFCIARDSRQFKKGIALCEKAIALNPHHSDHYLHLGRIHLLAGRKELAIATFRRGLKIRMDRRIIHELQEIGIRKAPPFASLSRTHILNIVTGKMLRLLNLR